MSGKADFSVDEWDLLRSSPVMASLLVAAASPSGLIGLVQESSAASKVIMQTSETAQTPLLKSLSADVMQTMTIPKPPPGTTPGQVQEAATEILRRTSALVSTKATLDEASEVRAWLVKVAQATAEAAREGGFLGFGGASVSDEEKAALGMLNAALSHEVAQ
jgi:hypothetical protein